MNVLLWSGDKIWNWNVLYWLWLVECKSIFVVLCAIFFLFCLSTLKTTVSLHLHIFMFIFFDETPSLYDYHSCCSFLISLLRRRFFLWFYDINKLFIFCSYIDRFFMVQRNSKIGWLIRILVVCMMIIRWMVSLWCFYDISTLFHRSIFVNNKRIRWACWSLTTILPLQTGDEARLTLCTAGHLGKKIEN